MNSYYLAVSHFLGNREDGRDEEDEEDGVCF